MKSNNLLNYDDQKQLYEKYSVDTLESLDTLYYYVLEENAPMALNYIYQKKYEENADNYNGREELTESILLDNFDISEITNSLKDLSDQELAVIAKPIYKAISKTGLTNPESNIEKQLIEYDKAHQNEIEKRFTPIYKGMLLKDVKTFFLKFSLTGLEFFDNILDYTSHERIDEIRRVKNEALDIKHKRYTNNITNTLSTVRNCNLTQFKSSFSALTDFELEFLHTLVEDATMHLNRIKDYPDYYKEEIENFDINNYPIELINKLLKLVEEEQTINRPLEKASSNVKEDDEEKKKTK